MAIGRLRRLKTYYRKYKQLPSFDEATKILGYQSKSSVHRYFNKLIDKKYLKKEDGKYIPTSRFFTRPLVGSVVAGFPIDMYDEYDVSNISLDEMILEGDEKKVMLRIKGESMKNAGIDDGDIAVVNRDVNPCIGDIVVSKIDGAWTIKRLINNKGNYELKAENDEFPLLIPKNELTIYGVVKNIIKSY